MSVEEIDALIAEGAVQMLRERGEEASGGVTILSLSPPFSPHTRHSLSSSHKFASVGFHLEAVQCVAAGETCHACMRDQTHALILEDEEPQNDNPDDWAEEPPSRLRAEDPPTSPAAANSLAKSRDFCCIFCLCTNRLCYGGGSVSTGICGYHAAGGRTDYGR